MSASDWPARGLGPGAIVRAPALAPRRHRSPGGNGAYGGHGDGVLSGVEAQVRGWARMGRVGAVFRRQEGGTGASAVCVGPCWRRAGQNGRYSVS